MQGRALVTEEKEEEEEDWAIGSGECPPVTFDPLSSAGSPPRRVRKNPGPRDWPAAAAQGS